MRADYRTDIGDQFDTGVVFLFQDFCEVFRGCFKGSYDAYSGLENERLFVLRPAYIQRWVYSDGVPYIESFDIPARKYSFRKYSEYNNTYRGDSL